MQTFTLVSRRTLPTSQSVLPVLAYASSAALFLTVAGGIQAFYLWLGDNPFGGIFYAPIDNPEYNNSPFKAQPLYIMCAWVAGFLLLTPLFTLGASAARLSARRRDDRLATLRLLGASTGRITAMTVGESVIYATVGFVLGFVLHLALVFPFGALHFQGIPLGAAHMLLPLPTVLLCLLVCLMIAALSSLFGLSKVTVSPLGVRAKIRPASPGKKLLIAGAVLIILAVFGSVLANMLAGQLATDPNNSSGPGTLAVFFIIAFIFGLPILLGMVAVDLIGGFIVGLYARIRLKKAKTPEQLLAYRTILESPRAAWRQVSGVAMTTFIAAFAGPILAMGSTLPSAELTNAERHIAGDLWQGTILMLLLSYLLVAVSALLNQAAAIYERSSLYSSLSMLGAEQKQLRRARQIVVFGPLVLVSVISALVAFPMFVLMTGAGLSVSSLISTVTLITGSILFGLILVYAALRTTGPIMRTICSKPVSAL